ncbi:hypothetical protein F2Q69_00016911 [Brassica cretica]|uniref:Uncharacterized protein n=1 Tax=Brassica cretica TaxID=69181 RepID=A0A8S9QNH1_BRACR|nr:hypothetical protein F2Q69_00016911 [Brassica cretica]
MKKMMMQRETKERGFKLQAVNSKLTAMNKLLMEENDRLRKKKVSHLVHEKSYFCQHTPNASLPDKDTSCNRWLRVVNRWSQRSSRIGLRVVPRMPSC